MHDIKAKARSAMKTRVSRAMGGSAHGDEAADRTLVKRMVKGEALTGKARGGSVSGRHKSKGKTQVNVIVSPGRGQDRPVPVPVPAGAAGQPPLPSRAPVAPPAAPGAMAPPPGMRPPGMKRGGKAVKRADGGKVGHHYTAGAATGEGRLEKRDAYGKKARV